MLAKASLKLSLVLSAILLTAITLNAKESNFEYLGEKPPGDIPVIFAKGIVSLSDRRENVITFSPDGKACYFSTLDGQTFFMEYKNGKWTKPELAEFSQNRVTCEPAFTLYGRRVYLAANDSPNAVGGSDLCYIERKGDGWGELVNLGEHVNTVDDEYHPCIVSDGSIYFTGLSGFVTRCQYENGKYQEPVTLPYPINIEGEGLSYGDPFVSKDESYMIFKSNRPGGFGDYDLYISYHKKDGSWTNPKNLGNKINTPKEENAGDVSFDGRYMFFARDWDIYWVKADFIDSLRKTNFAPYVKSPIEDQTTYKGLKFSYQIPEGTFIDDDGNKTLTYTVNCDNSKVLPAGLHFDAKTRTLSGVPDELGVFEIKVTATDNAKATASCIFEIKVNDYNTGK